MEKKSEMRRVHLFISGRVQGVAFRAYTQEQAYLLGLSGWVRNLRDGRVEAVFEGPKESIEAMIEWCKVGPPGARVVHVEVVDEPFGNEFKDFKIRFG
ncbi:MAG: acylphosphatase [Syntrophales bacterium]|nr:acylphosphatase [Syntrophales bacterium]